MRLRAAFVIALAALAVSVPAASASAAPAAPTLGVVIDGVPPRGCSDEFDVVVRAIGAPGVRRLVLRLDGRRIALRRGRDVRLASETIDCTRLALGRHQLSASARTRTAHRTTYASFTVNPPPDAATKPARASSPRVARRVKCRGVRQRGRGRATPVRIPPKRNAPIPSIGGVDTRFDGT